MACRLRFEGPQEQAPSTELDVLAMAAEQISMEEIEHGAVDVQAQDDQSLPRGALGIKEPRGLYKRRRSGRLRPPARGIDLQGIAFPMRPMECSESMFTCFN